LIDSLAWRLTPTLAVFLLYRSVSTFYINLRPLEVKHTCL